MLMVRATYALLADAVTPLTLSAAVGWLRFAAEEFGPLLPLLAGAAAPDTTD